MATAATEALDKRLAGLVVKAGLASEEQVEECLGIRAKLVAAGAGQKTLADVLLQKGYVTKDGAAKVVKLADDVKAAAFSAAPETKKKPKPQGDPEPGALRIPGYDILELHRHDDLADVPRLLHRAEAVFGACNGKYPIGNGMEHVTVKALDNLTEQRLDEIGLTERKLIDIDGVVRQ